MNLYTASNQWASRPADERFATLEDLQNFWRNIEHGTKVVDLDSSAFHTESHNGEIVAVGRQNIPAKFSHTGFDHLAGAAQFSPTELRKLADSPTLVSNILNNRLKTVKPEGWKMVLYQNGDVRARAFVSSKYGFISNSQIVSGLQAAQQRGWRTPPARPALENQPGTRPATQADILNDQGFGLSVKEGDLIAPAGLYASWDDIFIFMVNEDRRLSNGLARGIFVWNNLTKSRRFEVTTFYYNHVCANHIVWSASEVKKHRVIHIGENAGGKAMAELSNVISSANNASAQQDEQRIAAASQKLLAATNDDVIDLVYSDKGWVTKSQAEQALQAAEEHPEDHGSSDPKSVWGFVNGLTRVSQQTGFANERANIDLAAGKILETVF